MGRHERRAAEGGDVARVRGADVGPAEEAEVLVEGAREAEAPEVARQPPRVEAALAVELEEPRHAPGLCRNQPLVWGVPTKLENSLARSNQSRFG